MNELDAPLGLDSDRHDSAHNHAAVAVFGITVVAILAGSVGWYSLRPSQAAAPDSIEFGTPALTIVPADAPMLRQELRDEPVTAAARSERSITIIDGKTGKRETITVGPDMDGPDDDATSIAR